MTRVWGELGVRETPGPDSTPRILEYDTATKLKATDDAVPWCAAFVCWVLEQSGWRSTKSARARDYEQWGLATQPRYGCVVVFWRGSLLSGNGHVGFYVDADAGVSITDQPGRIIVLGGNQGDAVSVEAFNPDRVLAYRWPVGV